MYGLDEGGEISHNWGDASYDFSSLKIQIDMTDDVTKRGAGRPKKESKDAYTIRFQTRLTPSQAKAFRALAERRGVSTTRLMRAMMTRKIDGTRELVVPLDFIVDLRRSCGRLEVIGDRLGRSAHPDIQVIQQELGREIAALREALEVCEGGGS